MLRGKPLTHAVANRIAKIEDHFVSHPIEDVQAFLSSRNKMRIKKDRKVLRYVCLPGARGLDKVADADLAVAERVEYLQPHRFGERAKSRGY